MKVMEKEKRNEKEKRHHHVDPYCEIIIDSGRTRKSPSIWSTDNFLFLFLFFSIRSFIYFVNDIIIFNS